MNRTLVAAGVAAVALALTSCSSARPDAATVNGVGIDRADFERSLQAFVDNEAYVTYAASQNQKVVGPGGDGTVTMDFTDSRLQTAILFEMVGQEVDRRGIEISPEIRQAAEQQAKLRFAPADQADNVWNAFPEWFREDTISETADVLALQDALGGGTLDDAALRQIYDENPAKFGQACIRHILVASEGEAQQVKAELDAGATFDSVAESKGTDASAQQGGRLYEEGQDCPSTSSYVAPFVDGAFSVPVGQVTAPVQTQFGWHIIRVDKVTEVPFEQAKDAVAQYASGRADAALSAFLSDQAKNQVSVDPKYGSWDATGVRVVPPGLEVLASTTTAP